jgi:Transposase DNA-binding
MDEDERTREERGWVEEEFREVLFGDKRLRSRLYRVGRDLFERCEYPINVASQDWAATKGAYCLFANENVTAEKIFCCHREKVRERIACHALVLAVHRIRVILIFQGTKRRKAWAPNRR